MSIFNFHGTDFEEYAPENSVLKNPPIKWDPEETVKADELFTYINATRCDDYNPNTNKFIGAEIKEIAEIAGIDVDYLRVETHGPKVHIEVEAERNGLFARFKFYMGEQGWFSYDDTYKTVIRFKTSKVKELLARINEELNKVEANRRFPFITEEDAKVISKLTKTSRDGNILYRLQKEEDILKELENKALAVIIEKYGLESLDALFKYINIAMHIENHSIYTLGIEWQSAARLEFAKFMVANQHLTIEEGGKRFLKKRRR